MSQFTFNITSQYLDENYQPSQDTRATTNFANLARGDSRQQNLKNALHMINNRFNALAHWDNPEGDRYSLELEIISVEMGINASAGNASLIADSFSSIASLPSIASFPSIEVLKTHIIDHTTHKRIEGIIGNNFSSYLRDYDFSVLLSEHNKNQKAFSVPDNFGDLHGNIFQHFVASSTYKQHFSKRPVICLSVSDTKTYHRIHNHHPILGAEYQPNESSLTEQYFKKMGLKVRYFMPHQSAAPLAFYHFGDLVNDYTNLELISTISTMETFQKIYRPEIYNANAIAGHCYKPNLNNVDHSLTNIVYDRQERSELAVKQGKFAEEHFIKPYQTALSQWQANQAS